MLRRKGGPAVRASDLGGRDSPALCHRHLPWPWAHPVTVLCKSGSKYLLCLWEVGCLIPGGVEGCRWREEPSSFSAGLWRVR